MHGLIEINDDNQLRNIAYSGLKHFAHFCEKNDLCYYLTGGTLLGAVRHQGWIPWDDDIDVGMPRSDYLRMIELSSTLSNDEWQLESIYTNDDYLFYWSKLCNRQTIITPSRFSNGFVYGVSIDIFPLDAFDEKLAIEEEISTFSKQYRKLYYQHAFNNLEDLFFKRDRVESFLKYKIIAPILRSFLPKPIDIVRRLDKKYTDNDWNQAKYVGYICLQSTNQVWPKYCFDNRCLIQFEDEMFWASKDYDTMLTLQYGDYMKLPPEESRVSNHLYIAYRLPEGYSYNDYNKGIKR